MGMFKTEVRGFEGAASMAKLGRRYTSEVGKFVGRMWDLQGSYARRLKKLYVTESVNYEELDSPSRREQHSKATTSERLLRAIITLIIGTLIAGLVTMIVLCALLISEKLQYQLFHNVIQNESKSIWARWAIAACICFGLAWASCLLVIIYPAVGGSGLPEVLAFLNGVVVRPYLKFRVLALKSLAMVLSYSSGLFLDMEAPIIHVGTLVAVTMGRVFFNNPRLRRLYYNATASKLEAGGEAVRGAVHQDETFRVYAAAGAAVGMSIALRTPVGGVAFVLEEATSFFKPKIIIQTMYMTIIAYWILLAVLKSGNMKNITREVLSFFYDVSCTQEFSYHHIIWDVLLGLVCGVLGRLIIVVYLALQEFRMQFIRPRALFRFLEVTFLAFITISVIVFVPLIPSVGECRPIESAFESQFNRVGEFCDGYCEHGHPVYEKACFASRVWNQCNTHRMENEIVHESMKQLFIAVYDRCDGYPEHFTYFGNDPKLSVAQQAFMDSNLNHMVVSSKGSKPPAAGATNGQHEVAGGDKTLDQITDPSVIHTLKTGPVTPEHSNENETEHKVPADPNRAILEDITNVPVPEKNHVESAPEKPKPGKNESKSGNHTAPVTLEPAHPRRRSADQVADVIAWARAARAAGTIEHLPEDLQHAVRNRRASAPTGPPTCFYELRSLLWVNSHGTIKHLFSMGVYDLFHASSLALFLLFYTPVAIATSGLALPAGMVVPVMVIGAAGGRLLGLFLNFFYQELGYPPIDPGGYAILGACGLWTGVMQIPFTVCIIMFEMTGFNVTMWGPELMVVVLVATGVSRWFGHSLYHMEMHLNNLPFLAFEAPHEFGNMNIDKAMAKPVVCFKPVEGMQSVKKILSETSHNAYPLVDNNGALKGLVLREELEVAFLDAAKICVGNWWDRDDPINIEQLDYHRSPTTVRPTELASHAYNMIRQLGLRYLIVIDDKNRPVGIVTRKDLQVHDHGHDHGHHGKSGHGHKRVYSGTLDGIPRSSLLHSMSGMMSTMSLAPGGGPHASGNAKDGQRPGAGAPSDSIPVV